MRPVLLLAALVFSTTLACTSTCPQSQVLCDGVCTAVDSDNANCGACGVSCVGGQVCAVGSCGCPEETPTACGRGQALTCRNLDVDPDYCGSCDIACNGDDHCSGGVCRDTCTLATETACPPGDPTYCAVIETDRNNCGGCGIGCHPDETCGGGACAECIPAVSTLDSPPGPVPGGLSTICGSSPCPVVICSEITYWVFSYVDNRSSFNLVGYDFSGAILKGPTEVVGDRYIAGITVDSGGQTVSLSGQSGTVVVPWSAFRLP